MEPKKFESIEQLEAFLASEKEWEYGFPGLTVGLLLDEYGKLREFYCKVHNLVGAFETGAVEAGK